LGGHVVSPAGGRAIWQLQPRTRGEEAARSPTGHQRGLAVNTPDKYLNAIRGIRIPDADLAEV
jgi:hypothetical protein